MLTARIYTLLAIEKSLLLVFYTSQRGYQFRIVKASGEIWGTDDIFYSEDAALDEARQWLRESDRS